MGHILKDIYFRLHYTPADNPLENFYIPALSASIQYDRSAGYFSSSALAVAASGVARLIQNGGCMRLLVGADLSEQDVEAIRQGHDLQDRLTQRLLERFPDPQDALMAERLSVLAWMVAEGSLQIKVVFPTTPDGLPIPAPLTQDYYHPKSGIFTDEQGNQVAFSGSINESESGWLHNYENFSVYTSWGEGQNYIPTIREPFEKLWLDQDPNWIALPVPTAIQERLLRYRPLNPPVRDPLEKTPATRPIKDEPTSYLAGSPQAESILFQFLRDAPRLPNANDLGSATSAITPWPHQSRVANQFLQRFPESALFCDEVGLGKTIETGLVLRQLLLSGAVQRALILAPKSVLRQWQEELYEKFNLMIPRYDNGKFLDVDDQLYRCANSYTGDEVANPWDACDLLLAGSQLAKRNDRRSQILAARPWDLVIVDEAHHARRKDFKERIYRPNQLLSLLNELKENHKASTFLLMTATPMQVHPLEVWDLLNVTGLSGRWAASEDAFLAFFEELRRPFPDADWDFIFDMVQDFFESGGQIDPDLKSQALAELGPVQWASLAELPGNKDRRRHFIRQASQITEEYIKEMARRHTPISQSIYRNTRRLLREYQKRGILKVRIPKRKPQIQRIEMRQDELDLYHRIEEYITYFYQKYEQERRGLGFIMTVYRRRLTSSFYAVRCSLERRMQFLEGRLAPQNLYQEDDIEQESLDLDIDDEALDAAELANYQAEKAYLQDFLHKLKQHTVDSKMEFLKREINQVLRFRDKLLIFTQYTDTLDYLRNELVVVYGSQIACYSGRGGEVWNGIGWALTTKEDVKTRFKQGEVKILIGTESASEGLNLQTCGVLVNYDMPWNPMRVEQRIGRIDRIGQDYTEVWISNYFYQGTIEDLIYQRLSDRIDWFEVVVGELQPILVEVGEATRRLAMLPLSEREVQLEKEIASLRQRLSQHSIEALNLDDYLEQADPRAGLHTPVTLPDIQSLLTQSQATGALFRPHPLIPNAFFLSWRGEQLAVTFSPPVFDEHPDTLRFLSYGSPLFAELLTATPAPEPLQSGRLFRSQASGDLDLCGWYLVSAPDQPAQPLSNYVELKNWLEMAASQDGQSHEATTLQPNPLAADYRNLADQRCAILKKQRYAEVLTLHARARDCLLKAAMVEIALGRNPEFFDADNYPSDFSDVTVRSLARHRAPWAPLLTLIPPQDLKPDENDPYFQLIANEKRETLRKRFTDLTGVARKLAHELVEMNKTLQQEICASEPEMTVQILY